MNQKAAVKTLTIVLSLAVVGMLSYLAIINKTQSPSIEEKLTVLRCWDHEYSIEDKKLENVDIVRIIENLGQNESNGVCTNINLAAYPNSVVGIAIKPDKEPSVYLVVLYRRDDDREKSDPFHQSVLQFKFDFSKRQVYFKSPMDGSFNPIGIFVSSNQISTEVSLHQSCSTNAECSGSAQCVSYYGFAGQAGPKFSTCEIPCNKSNPDCPNGLICGDIADGPGPVCY